MEMHMEMPAEPVLWDRRAILIAIAVGLLFVIAIVCLIGQWSIGQRNPCAGPAQQADPLCSSPGIRHN